MRLSDEMVDMIWDGLSHRISEILLKDEGMTLEKHNRIMKEIKELHYGKTE